MDPLTHGLASYAITRAAFPRVSRTTLLASVLGGAAADLDQFSAYWGPSAFLAWYRTVTHSVIGTLAIAAVFVAAVFVITRGKPKADPVRIVLAPIFAACALHVAMDLTQNQNVQLLWPFRAQRNSAEWVARFDLWILAILLAGVLLPQLFALVTEEIGAKSKTPRGRVGATIALVTVLIYIGGRSIWHGNAVALMENRSYRGESPRRVAAFAESDSPWHWRGIVETERAFYDLDIGVGPGSTFNPDSAVVSYKPEGSAALDAARATESVRRFLEAAQFLKASVEKTNGGYRVQLRDLAEEQESRSRHRVMAIVETDANARVLSDDLAWDRR
jgi:membrane-bound metal-dependent hydrolase YbcI (DUF457 family)